MSGFFKITQPVNEPIFSYSKGSPEREKLLKALQEARSVSKDVPMIIDGKEVYTNHKEKISPPHDHQHVLGTFSVGNKEHVKEAINAALAAKADWGNMDWEMRAPVFLKAADLISGPYRARLNAATMLGQSKNVYQAEIDAACEMADFLRFNVYFLQQIYEMQPLSAPGVWNRSEYRALEGFVFALTPFNFTAIAGNLPTAPAIAGNVVVWKPAYSQVYSASLLMEIFMEAGLPDGVINLVFVDGPEAGEIVFSHPEFAGLHFTGSTSVFQKLWKTIGDNIHIYKSYPRVVGETGGKDFVLAHPSADAEAVAVALVRGAFEYQGQKCSAASRAYIPQSLWVQVKDKMVSDLSEIKMGGVEDFSNFVNAVIDEKAFDKIVSYIEHAKSDKELELIAGGGSNKSRGYFVEPTVFVTKNPSSRTMCEEIFGPVLTIYVYPDKDFDNVVKLVDTTSPYGLTGALLSNDRSVVSRVSNQLKHAAGNFYINDKPTGAVVGQQPFGGGRSSGTNDKAGSLINMMRWVSPRTIKENFNPPTNYRYPFMD